MFLRFACKSCLNFVSDNPRQLKSHCFYSIYCKINYLQGIKLTRTLDNPQVQCFLSTSVLQSNTHTTKGWKSIARTGQRKDESLEPDRPHSSCEEGPDALPHSVLINHLQNSKTVSEQIDTFCSLISLTTEDFEKRKQFCNSLTEIFRPYFSKFKVHQFGSSINGLGFKGCDLDLSIQTIFDNQDYLSLVKEVPTLDSVIHGAIPAQTVARLPPRFMLRFIRRILRQHCKDVREPIFLIKARCPILRFYNEKYDLYCDFSCENEASLRNTKLLRLICLLEPRFTALTKFIRYWGKYGGFVGDIDMFNSYAFSLLVLHFLQHTSPPVLPPLKDIIEASEYLMHADISDETLLFEDLKKFKPSKNIQPVEELLREYFFYFLNFDYSKMMMPLTSSIMPKTSFLPSVTDNVDAFVFSPVTVQDPFRTNFNVTAAAVFKSCKRFLNGTVDACRVYQNDIVWKQNSEMWGVSSLFHQASSEDALLQDWKENRNFTINLPLKSKSDIVKSILQKCLLFECSEFKLNSEDGQPSLKLNCNVYNNTWQGREWVRQNCPQSMTNSLEIENWVSKEVLKSRGEHSKQVLFTFLCKCYENMSDKRLDVVLTFPESKCSPIVVVFLKDYIPSIYEKLVV